MMRVYKSNSKIILSIATLGNFAAGTMILLSKGSNFYIYFIVSFCMMYLLIKELRD